MHLRLWCMMIVLMMVNQGFSTYISSRCASLANPKDVWALYYMRSCFIRVAADIYDSFEHALQSCHHIPHVQGNLAILPDEGYLAVFVAYWTAHAIADNANRFSWMALQRPAVTTAAARKIGWQWYEADGRRYSVPWESSMWVESSMYGQAYGIIGFHNGIGDSPFPGQILCQYRDDTEFRPLATPWRGDHAVLEELNNMTVMVCVRHCHNTRSCQAFSYSVKGGLCRMHYLRSDHPLMTSNGTEHNDWRFYSLVDGGY